MCNLYTLAPWEVRHLIRHYTLIGRDFEEVMRGRNETLDVYPNRPAPVVIEQDGQRIVRQDMLWGFPPFKPGAGYGTNFRSLKNHLWRPWLDRETAASCRRQPSPSPTRTRLRAPWCGAGSSELTSSPSSLPGSGGHGPVIEGPRRRPTSATTRCSRS
jgi:hypothetical protein